MAETVQYRMEKMSDELDELEQRGLFTRLEISQIVKQRRNFEFKLKRPSPLLFDFLSYIDYEKSIDKLRLLRKKLAINININNNGHKGSIEMENGIKKKKNKKMGSDYAGMRRILDIYGRATKRFKGDVALWFRYLDYCREKKNGLMNKVQATMLRLHPKVPSVWIYAAAWEFDHNADVEAARNLMQYGLRHCPNSEDLWIEYLRMELTYLSKCKARKVALGEDKGTLVRNPQKVDDKPWRDENKELFMSLDEKKKNDDVTPVVGVEETNTGLDSFREKGLNILKAVYSDAVNALPTCFGLRKRFIEILDAIDDSEELRRNILNDMRRDFSKEPEFWDWLARTEITDSSERNYLGKEIVPSQLEKAIQVYEEATKVSSSPQMFRIYTRFLRDIIFPTEGEKESSEILNSSDRDMDFISRLLKVYERAERDGCVTEDLACQHVTLYLQLGKLEEAKILAKKLCNGELLNAVDLWVLRLSIELRCNTEMSGSMTKDGLSSVFKLLKRVLSDISVSKAESLWVMVLKTFGNQKDDLDKLVELSMCSLTRDGGSDEGFSLSSAVVELLLQSDGIERARKTYKRFLALPRPGLVLYKNCMELEMNLALAGGSDALVKARELFESALTTYKDDVSLWQNYYSMEIKMGKSETANSVYWRAKKQLKENIVLLSSANL